MNLFDSMNRMAEEAEPATDAEVTVSGTVHRIFFCNERFCTGRLFLDAESVQPTGSDFLSFAGPVALRAGDSVTLLGRMTRHEKYGWQLQVVRKVHVDPARDVESLARWIREHDAAAGIGKVRAERIARHFGARFAEVLRENPEEIAAVAGVPAENVRELARAWLAEAEFNAVAVDLTAWELNESQIRALARKHGLEALPRMIAEDPYFLCRDVKGFGFERVDRLAREKLDIAPAHPGRLRAACEHTMRAEVQGEGSTCIEMARLLEMTAETTLGELKNGRPDLSVVGPGLVGAVKALVQDKAWAGWSETDGTRWLAPAALHRMEHDLFRLFAGQRQRPHPSYPAELATPGVVQHHFPNLDPSQVDAVVTMLTHRFSVMTGGAGTGKTISIRALIRALERQGLNVLQCAPTGKAAARMEESTGREAQTIHRMLEFRVTQKGETRDADGNRKESMTGIFERHEHNPLRADVVIVDEFSMVDSALAWHLTRALDPHTALVFVGDHNQLPSVGPGSVLRDVLKHDLIAASILTTCHRQAGDLKLNCAAIVRGELVESSSVEPEPDEDGRQRPAAWNYISRLHRPEQVMEVVEELFTRELPTRFGYNVLTECQFLSPMKKGPLGVWAINTRLQKLYQAGRGIEVEPVANMKPHKFYVGDKVIHTKNNYSLGVFNGYQGIVINLAPLTVEFDPSVGIKVYNNENRRELQLAYCLTYHKVQGSEWPVAVVICHSQHSRMLHRNLFYTGDTRAAESVYILTDGPGARSAVRNVRIDDRRTTLSLLARGGGGPSPEPEPGPSLDAELDGE